MMSRAIRAYQTAAVDGKRHIQILQANVVYQLIISALQKRRIDGHHRFHAFGGQPGSKCQRMLFGDPDVEITIGILL